MYMNIVIVHVHPSLIQQYSFGKDGEEVAGMNCMQNITRLLF